MIFRTIYAAVVDEKGCFTNTKEKQRVNITRPRIKKAYRVLVYSGIISRRLETIKSLFVTARHKYFQMCATRRATHVSSLAGKNVKGWRW